MAKEIERKFLVKDSVINHLKDGVLYRQGYLSSVPERIVRLRIYNGSGYITVKGFPDGITRPEYEYKIPVVDAAEMLDSICEKPIIEKIRYKIEHKGNTWEVDKFLGENEGLIVAEIELENEAAAFIKPEWLGEEVTYDPRYLNSNLIRTPFKCWNG
ncbi:MAG: CYTH domain-containing protein [Clostridiaceae bacterium]|nr:CYTH domain-containing protein [Clostridiaceae bacterium]